MKRLWLGAGILVILLALSAGVSMAMARIHEPIARDLTQAALAAEEAQWQQAQTLVEGARQRWERWRHFTATVADHTPMEALEGLFAQLPVLLDDREQPDFSAAARNLAALAWAMADSQRPSWWNLL